MLVTYVVETKKGKAIADPALKKSLYIAH